ncbi:hypothetical protein SAMN05428963_12087 [Consotaella salsifontis]|uniref:Uncharacterized protein n=1 Tax=Consotaella salsifontis TaxID=1365950 RepID=A0A1T4T7H3_9HYPH|nr:hypothetical protein SAMN05428963_12087 [Consotaella salsifontis]
MRWRDWRNQRTRWMKGWMQTWLVHMRQPVRLCRELGLSRFLCFQVLFFGMIASTIAQPFFFGFLAWTIWSIIQGGAPSPFAAFLFATDTFNIIFGIAAFAVLALRHLDDEERRVLPRHLWWIHAYWLLISLASLRALGQLFRTPHHWEKTPHGVEAQAAPTREEEAADTFKPMAGRSARMPA